MNNYMMNDGNAEVAKDPTIRETMIELSLVLNETNETVNAIARAIYVGCEPRDDTQALTNKDEVTPPLRDMCRDYLELAKRTLMSVQALRDVLW